jgi:hypothetical protein
MAMFVKLIVSKLMTYWAARPGACSGRFKNLNTVRDAPH